MSSFKSYSKYYDLLYSDKNYLAETEYLDNLIRSYHQGAISIVDLGCGTGKHAKLLAKRGYELTGVDLSEDMIAIAKIDSDLDFNVGNIATFRLSKKFDVALSIFHVFSYLTSNEALIEAFSNVNAHLHEKGIFIIDVWHTPAVHSQIPESRTKVYENQDIKIIRKAEPKIDSLNNLVNVRYEVDVVDKLTLTTESVIEDHHIRHFSKPEIDLLAKFTGFKILHCEELISAHEPSESTWGVCYILQKIKTII